MTNQDIAARIVGYIRQAAIGDALVPYEQRVDRALQKILASSRWTTPQRQWLQKIAAQTKANLIVDREALDDPDQSSSARAAGSRGSTASSAANLSRCSTPSTNHFGRPRPDIGRHSDS